MIDTIELSKRLLELAALLDNQMPTAVEIYRLPDEMPRQWAADLRSIAIPEPVGERE